MPHYESSKPSPERTGTGPLKAGETWALPFKSDMTRESARFPFTKDELAAIRQAIPFALHEDDRFDYPSLRKKLYFLGHYRLEDVTIVEALTLLGYVPSGVPVAIGTEEQRQCKNAKKQRGRPPDRDVQKIGDKILGARDSGTPWSSIVEEYSVSLDRFHATRNKEPIDTTHDQEVLVEDAQRLYKAAKMRKKRKEQNTHQDA